jgi:uncharacterized surface protein with fasciclin (FAS1) repeats
MFSRLTKVVPLMLVLVLLAISAVPAFAAPKDIDSIVDVALEINGETGEFSILIAALLAADPAVISTLDGKGQFTVFAPTDEAFVALLNELGLTADELLSDQELVTEVLLYHVAHGRRYANSVVTAERIHMLNKSFTYPDGATLTDNQGRTANIVMTDVSADNGVIHVIDKVVLP